MGVVVVVVARVLGIPGLNGITCGTGEGGYGEEGRETLGPARHYQSAGWREPANSPEFKLK